LKAGDWVIAVSGNASRAAIPSVPTASAAQQPDFVDQACCDKDDATARRFHQQPREPLLGQRGAARPQESSPRRRLAAGGGRGSHMGSGGTKFRRGGRSDKLDVITHSGVSRAE